MHKGKVIVQRETDELRAAYRKVQVGFSDVPPTGIHFNGINVVSVFRNGNVFNLTVKGTEDDFKPRLEAMSPAFISAMPLTLEEVFLSEMEAAGYDAYHID